MLSATARSQIAVTNRTVSNTKWSLNLQFAETECRGYSEAYYRLALAVADADDVIGFLAAMPVIRPNLFFESIQLCNCLSFHLDAKKEITGQTAS